MWYFLSSVKRQFSFIQGFSPVPLYSQQYMGGFFCTIRLIWAESLLKIPVFAPDLQGYTQVISSPTHFSSWCLLCVFILHQGLFLIHISHSSGTEHLALPIASRIQTALSREKMYRVCRGLRQFSGKRMHWELLTRHPPGNTEDSAVVWMKTVLHS